MSISNDVPILSAREEGEHVPLRGNRFERLLRPQSYRNESPLITISIYIVISHSPTLVFCYNHLLLRIGRDDRGSLHSISSMGTEQVASSNPGTTFMMGSAKVKVESFTTSLSHAVHDRQILQNYNKV